MLYHLKIYCLDVKEKHHVGALVSIDFGKAFESLWLKGLLLELYACGVKGKLLLLKNNILLSRSLSIEIILTEAPGLEQR